MEQNQQKSAKPEFRIAGELLDAAAADVKAALAALGATARTT